MCLKKIRLHLERRASYNRNIWGFELIVAENKKLKSVIIENKIFF